VARKRKQPDSEASDIAGEANIPRELLRSLHQQPGYLIRRLHQISVSVFLMESSHYDLTQLQYVALAVIDAYPGIDQGRLGRAVALDRQTVSTVVRRLVQKGLLSRESKDLRTSALYVTGSGKALHQIMAAKLAGVGDRLLEPLDDSEKRTLLGLIAKVVTAQNSLSRAPQEISGNRIALGHIDLRNAETSLERPRRKPAARKP